jgi:hypothetical protein
MLMNFQEPGPLSNMDRHPWQRQLAAIGDRTAIGGLAVATALLQRFKDNDLKMKKETLFWMIDVVKGLILRINQEDEIASDNDDQNY